MCSQVEDGYPTDMPHNGQGAPVMEEGETQELAEYPAPTAVKLEEDSMNGS